MFTFRRLELVIATVDDDHLCLIDTLLWLNSFFFYCKQELISGAFILVPLHVVVAVCSIIKDYEISSFCEGHMQIWTIL